MGNRIPYIVLTFLVLSKVFVWWLLFWGTDYSSAEPTLKGVFEPVHQISYSVLSTFLIVGILFKSRFSIVAMFVAAGINMGIYLYRGSAVYQSIFDPLVLVIFCLAVFLYRPNFWVYDATS